MATWAGQTWCELFKETSYGIFSGAGATAFPRLLGGNSFTCRRVVQRQVIRTADSGNRPIQVVANKQLFQGTLKTLLYPTQAAYWMTAAATLVSNDLPSYSLQYWDSVRPMKMLGGKIRELRIMSTSAQDYVTLEIDWQFQSNDDTFVTFTQPAQSSFPPENPYTHLDTKGNISIGGVAVTAYKDANITITNNLRGPFDEQNVIGSLTYCGRDLKFNMTPQYNSTTYRTAYEGQTPLAFIIKWAETSPAHSVTFTGNSSGYIASIADDLPLDDIGYQALSNEIFFDKVASTDFTVAVV